MTVVWWRRERCREGESSAVSTSIAAWYGVVEEMGRENPTSKAIVPVAVGMLADWLLQRQVPVPMQEVVLRLRQKLFANRRATPG